MTAADIIWLLKLEPLDMEGGHFRETWRSAQRVGGRSVGTAILYLLSDSPDSFSSMHRLAYDEIYHFYLGDPLELLLLEPGGQSRRVILGPDIANGQHVQFVVPAGVWQGSRLRREPPPKHGFTLLGTTMAPGFDGSDFEAGRRAQLVRDYPSEAELIAQLTRA